MSIEGLSQAETTHCLYDESYLDAVNERRVEKGLEEIQLVDLIISNISMVQEFPDLVDIFKENKLIWSKIKDFFPIDDDTEEEVEEE